MVAAAALILGRAFCGWLCPFGLFQDILTRLRKAARLRHLNFSDKTSVKLGQSRYIIIAVFMILSVIFASYAIFGTELIPGTRPGGPEGTEAGIVSNINEPFCLVCPMRPLCIIAEVGIGQMNWSYIQPDRVWTILDNRLLLNLNQPNHTRHRNRPIPGLPAVLVPHLPPRSPNSAIQHVHAV